jgi:hypothetical protein
LIQEENDASLHFYFANLTGMQKYLSPTLMQGYETWVTQGRRNAIAELPPASRTHWNALANQLLELYRANPDDLANRLQGLVENSKF